MTHNTKGLQDEDKMKEIIEEIKARQIHIVILTETHFENNHAIQFEELADEQGYTTYSITRLMRRYDTGSGGVTVMIDKQYHSREARKSKLEDIVWVTVQLGREKVFVGGVYLVPSTSSRGRKAQDMRRSGGTSVRLVEKGKWWWQGTGTARSVSYRR